MDAISRRGFLRSGGLAASSLLLPAGFVRPLYAQTTAFDFYISPNGSDSNPGTLSSPWSITALNTKRGVYAGKRVGLLDGVYNVALSVGYGSVGWSGSALNVAGGNASSPTLVAAVNPLKAVIDGQATSANNPEGAAVIGSTSSAGYITLRGLEVRNAYYQAIRFTGSTSFDGPRLYGIHVEDCYIHGVTNLTLGSANPAGIQVNNLDGGRFVNNRIEDLTSFDSRMSGIILWSSHNCVVDRCSFINTNLALNFKNRNNKNNTVQNCYIDQTRSSGVRSGVRLDSDAISGAETISNNIIIADVCYESDFYPYYSDEIRIYNNTFSGVPGWTAAGLKVFQSVGVRGIHFYNNILRRSSVGYRGDVAFTSGGIALSNYNCWADSPKMTLYAAGTDTPAISTFGSLDAWRGATGLDGNSMVRSDPGFMSSGVEAAQYVLSSSSPCRGAGRIGGVAGGVATDMGAWGNGATQIGSSLGVVKPAPVSLSVS